MELAVAVMLVLLGILNLSGALRRTGHVAHAHAPEAPPGRAASPTVPIGRSLAVGVVHGLAGSAAVALLVLASIRETGWALLYLLLFGLGTVVGMMLITTAIALPFAALAERFSRINQRIVQATSLVSIAFGLLLAYEIGIVGGLFSSTPRWAPH
jgi:high-affinity nickel-transport protein